VRILDVKAENRCERIMLVFTFTHHIFLGVHYIVFN
jgi:hypothetical protein